MSTVKRSLGKKIALVLAGSTLTCAVLTFGAALWFAMTYGKHVYTASLFATTFFFFTAAIVIYEMSKTRMYPPEEATPPAASPAEDKVLH